MNRKLFTLKNKTVEWRPVAHQGIKKLTKFWNYQECMRPTVKQSFERFYFGPEYVLNGM